MLVPAGIYLLFNYGGIAQAGAGIPMATDIAFALGILSHWEIECHCLLNRR
jgi:NhaA family Na+:H+ antiporter